ncbi:phosphotransferase [Streptomyces sp. XD-27]|uniref:phosphotransferase n=1 Tax=Streptomyces sp. XD-27 TaxID=3062779 RepID=UPI0026F43D8B|nr:phosphotransferase [Streptomyces sp. XD-27]WKX74514.1 phosphotransferase [Streptomyces sp. XD-27]
MPNGPDTPHTAWHGSGPAGEATVLADRPDGTVVRCGPVVAKAHAPAAGPGEPAALAARLRFAAGPRAAGILLPPLMPEPGVLPGGRLMTLWPYGVPVCPDRPEAVPWEEAGALLARLHTLPCDDLPLPLPPMRGPAKAALAVARLTASPAGGTAAADAVLRAWAGLPPWARAEAPAPAARAETPRPRGSGRPPAPGARVEAPGPVARCDGPAPGSRAVCHGDLHLGQLVRHPAPDGPWVLIDIDDLGLGDPAWDLARPAAWYAAGLLAPGEWNRLLTAYRDAGGPAVGFGDDPWPALDVPARALTVQSAATALAKAAAARVGLDEAAEAMVDACARIARLPEAVG